MNTCTRYALLLAAVALTGISFGCLSMPGEDMHVQTESAFLQAQTIEDLKPGEVFSIGPAIYAYAIADMQENLDRYLGQPVEIEGFVFRHDHFDGELFFTARMQITCCITDALFTGILVRSEDGAHFAQDSWVRVSGTVIAEPYHDIWTDRTHDAPVILSDAVVQIDKPEVAFVYPK